MYILYYTIGVVGSGSIVQGISIANALNRNNINAHFTILSSSPFAYLAEKSGIDHREITFEKEHQLSLDVYRDSQLYKALKELRPDVLLVDLNWFMLHWMLPEIECKKIFLCRQLADEAFTVPFPDNPISFDPSQYDHVIATEPFSSSVQMERINPVIIRNRNEIFSREKALVQLNIDPRETRPICFFAFNGKPGEYDSARKMYSYLEDEGYSMLYTTNYKEGLFPMVDYFNACNLLVCGAGYNAFWESVYFERETIYVPFPRKFENQRQRVTECQEYRFNENGADQLVELILHL